MDKKRLEHFKSRLLEEKENIRESLDGIEDRLEESRKDIDEQPSYSNHPADRGTELYMRTQNQGFKEGLQETLDEIDKSLEDIENGTYGYCENCQKNISEERLEIIPYAKTCLACSEEEPEDDITRGYETVSGTENPKWDSDVNYDKDEVYEDIMEDNIVANDPSYSTGDNQGIIDEREDYEITEDIEDMSFEINKELNKNELKKKKILEDEGLI